MVAQIASIEVTVTESETEALLLEYNLIKRHRPRFNVTLRDDKSFPYLYITTEHEFPRISFYRGTRKLPGRFFGPYPNARATRETCSSCRSCSCCAVQRHVLREPLAAVPAVPDQALLGAVRRPDLGEDYAQDVERRDQGAGRPRRRADRRARAAHGGGRAAAGVRARRAAARPDQRHQGDPFDAVVTRNATEDIDAVALVSHGGEHCVSIVFVRGGRNLGSTNFFPRAGLARRASAVGFLAQYYLGRDAPGEILVSQPIEDADLLEATLSERLERTVQIRSGVRGVRARWVELARTNAEIGLNMRRATEATTAEQLQSVAEVFGLSAPLKRIECFDISHTMGERTVASCVVFGPEGPLKSDYRRFNIEGLAPGDDYGALRQALSRRYARIKKGEAPLPDLLLIDGGPGQLAEAVSVLEELEIEASASPASPRAPTAGRGRSGCSSPATSTAHPCRRFAGTAPDPAHPRRGAPLRDHRPSRSAAPRRARTRCWRPSRGSGRASAGSCCGSSAGCRAWCAPASTTWPRCTASAASSRSHL